MADEFIFNNTVIEWNERHCRLLQHFLSLLETSNVQYVILKNHEGLPQRNYSKDIDILIKPGKYKQASELLQQAYKENGISNYKMHKFEKLRCWYGMNPSTHFAIHIDLLEGFFHKGFELFSFDLLYQNAYKNEQGIFILSPVYDCLVLLLHSTICYHSIKPKYAEKIASEFLTSKEDMEFILKKNIGKEASKRMTKLLENRDYDKISKLGKYFSHASKKKILINRPIFTFYNSLFFWGEKMQRIIIGRNRYNCFISVHAPDGTGKTTFIKKLAEELGFYFVCDPKGLTAIYHFRPLLFPNLGAVGEKAKVMKQDTNYTVPHRAKPAGNLSSLIRMTYYWLDYIIGMPLILRKNAKYNTITIFDRYIYDMVVDPERARIKLPYWIRKGFAKLVKSPQIVFVLNTDAQTVYNRKKELELDEIERQLLEFKRLIKWGNNFHLLDASKSPEEIKEEAIRVVLNKFTKIL